MTRNAVFHEAGVFDDGGDPLGMSGIPDPSGEPDGKVLTTASGAAEWDAPTGGAPSGAAGGVLSGTYPDPGFAADMATQAELDAVAAAKQPLDADLTAIAGLDSSTAGALATDGGGWIKKTYAQFKTSLGLSTADVPDSTDRRYVTDSELVVVANTSGTNTGDQTTVSGNAGTATKLASARNIDGQAFDGSANITVIAPGTHAATTKATPVDADELPLVDSAASNVLKKLTWANLKATVKAYTDTLYDATGAAAAAQAASQPVDSDLTAIAALSTTSFGRGLLELANAAAGRTAFGLGTAATSATGDFDAAGAASAAQTASQPLDSDLTAIAALTTTSYGRAFLALADAAAGRTALGLGNSATKDTGTIAGTVAAGDDSRLSDSRTPTAHATTHKPGGTDALMTVVRAHGTSASGTAGTSVASLAAAASNQLVALVLNCAQTNATGTQMTITVTYSDATTSTLTTTAVAAQTVLGNNDALILTTSGGYVSLTALSAKAITSVAVVTAGTGTGTRAASISAVQVPL